MTVSYPNFAFDIVAEDPQGSRARRGRLFTPHGVLDTPAFIFCATKAAMKACSPAGLREEKTQIILSNTYHLMLQPGADLVAKTVWYASMGKGRSMYEYVMGRPYRAR